MLNKEKSAKVLQDHFRKHHVANMKQLISLLKTNNRMSAFRRLKDLNYLSSYTHTGKYYTLPTVANFDSVGLWHVNNIGFSRFGTLKDTVINIIENSISGKYHAELEQQLQVDLHNTLLELIESKRISRVKHDHLYLYISENKTKAEEQIARRSEIIEDQQSIDISEWIIIQTLVIIIRMSQAKIDKPKVIKELERRSINIDENHLELILKRFNVKKTLDIL